MHNVEPGDDYDYLIVAAPGHVWLSRLLIVMLVVKPAARCGDVVCPNYILSEDALTLRERDLFHAHELAQMVPLDGYSVYERLRHSNSWADDFLPNAGGPPLTMPLPAGSCRPGRRILESVLRIAAGAWLERHEMDRLRRTINPTDGCQEVELSPDRCKGHTDAHGQGTFEAFAARLRGRE